MFATTSYLLDNRNFILSQGEDGTDGPPGPPGQLGPRVSYISRKKNSGNLNLLGVGKQNSPMTARGRYQVNS